MATAYAIGLRNLIRRINSSKISPTNLEKGFTAGTRGSTRHMTLKPATWTSNTFPPLFWLTNLLLYEPIVSTRMGKGGLISRLQEDQIDEMSAAAGYEEGSEEEEPYECEFYDDDDGEPQDVEHFHGTALPEDEDASDVEPFKVELCSDEGSGKCGSFHSEPYINLVPDGHNICRKQLYEVEPCHGLMTGKDEFVEKKSNHVQPLKQGQNKKELKQVLGHSDSVQKEDKHLCKRQEHSFSSSHDGSKLKEEDDTNLFVAIKCMNGQTDPQPTKEMDMGNLYVCNLPLLMNTEKLIDLFVPYGQLNGRLIEGKKIEVRVSGMSLRPSSLPVELHADNRTLREIDMSNLYVCNIPLSINTAKLVELFLPFVALMNGALIEGETILVRVADLSPSVSGSVSQHSPHSIDRVVMKAEYRLVLYADMNSAAKALKHMDGYLIEGKGLVVKGSEPCPVNAVDSAYLQSGSKLIKEIDMANLYANASSAAAAIDHLDGYQIGGSTLAVRVAGLPAESGAATNVHRQVDMTNLYVCHLPPYVTTEKLIELFLPCGQITQAKVVVDKFTGVSKGFGFVNYMAHFYSYFTSPDPSRMTVGIPTSHWPYYYGESAYNPYYYGESSYTTPAVYQGQGWSGPPGFEPHAVAKKDATVWTGPPGFEPDAVTKKDATVMNPSQACSKVHLAHSGGNQKGSSVV
ncbi:hypothetical protein BAE44_0000976 [Dichanthelium oligosanthes]|uniref:RRM domain-containing protein n=1 Tax=Dichanthelium oligosanthes TaxID=888268 RepID=A0A1E5WKP3_9POAL|nr:hypothetical protein BAE44_0000976 [Dichanthelium oligosanthes]